jgi:F-type H+-transporting ATPase subunit b
MKFDSKNKAVRRTRFVLQFLFVLSLLLTAAPRHAYALPADAAHSQQQPAADQGQHPANPEQQLTSASREAAHPGEQEDENAAFKYSSSVKFFSKMFGGDVVKGYWAFTILNFIVIAAVMLWLWRSVWPKVVVSRNERISKSLEEARRASQEAQRRLGDIETRLSRLDTEIANMRSQAERDGVAEQERMKAASAEEKRRILEAADQEIASATANARRELKAFTAEMAVNLAQSRIEAQIDENSDEQLVREFAMRLGKEGHA